MFANIIENLADKYKSLVEEVGQTIWKFAELSLEEYKSSAYLSKKLEEMGYTVTRGIGGYPTGFVGSFTNNGGKVVIGLLCEYDALPGVFDETGSNSGHGCGHNLFAAGAFGTAAIMKDFIENNNISATIKVFGTPAEELYGAKPYYVKQGIFDGVDCFMGFHPLEFNGVLYSQHNAIAEKSYNFYGKSSHAGAEPHLGISALDAVEIMNVTVNYLREHVTSDVRIHYIITNGGERTNVVPAFASSKYCVRAQELDNLKNVFDRIDNIARSIAMAVGCRVEIIDGETFANTILNRPLAELAYNNMCMIGGPKFTEEEQLAVKKMGFKNGLLENIKPLSIEPGVYTASTDEGDVSWQGPWIRICSSCLADGTPGHSHYVTKQANSSWGFKGTMQTIKVCTLTLVDLLTKSDELKKVKDDFAKRMVGKSYDRTYKTYPDINKFPSMPGAYKINNDEIAINPSLTYLIPDKDVKNIIIYDKDKKTGMIVIDEFEKEYRVKLSKIAESNCALTIKYVNMVDEEILLGYVK